MSEDYGYNGSYQPAPSNGGNGLAIAAFVCGILSVTICTGSGLVQIAAIIMGIIAMKQGQKKWMAVTGLVLGILGVVLTVILCIAAFGLGFIGGLMGY